MPRLTHKLHPGSRVQSDPGRTKGHAIEVWLRGRLGLAVILLVLPTAESLGQTSSIGNRVATGDNDQPLSREASSQTGSPVLEEASLIAVPVTEPKTFAEHDLITIIVREQKKFESDAETDSKKQFKLQSDLEAFVKFIDRGLGASTFSRGKPNIDYNFKSSLSSEADVEREDKFTTRITARIIDVKPNGNLVFEARRRITHDEEVTYMTLTGVTRSEDVTPDNTILSTQVADLVITVENEGVVRDGSRRGWIPKLLDMLRPI